MCLEGCMGTILVPIPDRPVTCRSHPHYCFQHGPIQPSTSMTASIPMPNYQVSKLIETWKVRIHQHNEHCSLWKCVMGARNFVSLLRRFVLFSNVRVCVTFTATAVLAQIMKLLALLPCPHLRTHHGVSRSILSHYRHPHALP